LLSSNLKRVVIKYYIFYKSITIAHSYLKGNGTLAILIDGSRPEEESIQFLDKLFRKVEEVGNLFQYNMAVMLLGVFFVLL
jgi:hypothetical protein